MCSSRVCAQSFAACQSFRILLFNEWDVLNFAAFTALVSCWRAGFFVWTQPKVTFCLDSIPFFLCETAKSNSFAFSLNFMFLTSSAHGQIPWKWCKGDWLSDYVKKTSLVTTVSFPWPDLEPVIRRSKVLETESKFSEKSALSPKQPPWLLRASVSIEPCNRGLDDNFQGPD